MVHCRHSLLAQFIWTLLLLAGDTSRLPAQEQSLGTVSKDDQGGAVTGEVVSLPQIAGKTTPTTELQAPGLEHLLNQLEAFRKAHTPFHIRHREVIKVRNASEIKAIESMGLPLGRLLDTEYESAFWDNRSWRRCLSRGVDGEQASDKRSIGDREGTAGLDVPFALLGVFIEPKPKNCKLTFDDIFPHITIMADQRKGHIELWMFPVSGHWIPKRVRMKPEATDEPIVDWEVNHIQSYGNDRPPQIIDGEVRFTARDGDEETTITTEFFITRALYGDEVVPGEIDPSLAPMPNPSEDHSTGNPMPLAVRILEGQEDREFLSHLEPLKAEGTIAVCDDPNETRDIVLTIDGPPLTDSNQFQELLRDISKLQLSSCIVNVKPQPRTDPRQNTVVHISARPEVSSLDVKRVVDLVNREPRVSILFKDGHNSPARPEEMLPQSQSPTEELRIFELKHVKASEAARIIEQLYNSTLSVSVDKRTNSVIIRGTRPVVNEVESLLQQLDTQEPVTKPASVANATGGDGTGLRVNVPAIGPAPLALDSSTPIRGAHSETFSFSIGVSGQNADDLQRQYDDLEQRAQSLSGQLRKPLPDPAMGETLRAQLRDTVRQAFETRQNLQRAELAEFARRLQSIQQSIEMREQISQQIIDRRVQELLNPNLEWEKPGTNRGSAPALRSPSPDSSIGASSHFGSPTDAIPGETQTVLIKFDSDSRKLGKVEWLSGPKGVMVDRFGDGHINAKHGEQIQMRLSELPGRENAIVFLRLEVSDDPTDELRRKRVVNPSEILSRNPIPLEVTSDDLDQAISGNAVTKVIYLPNDRKSASLFETIVSTHLEPNVDPFKVAREKGFVVAVVRISNHPNQDDVTSEAASSLKSPE